MQIRTGGNGDFPAITAAGLAIDARIRPEHMVVAQEEDGEIAGYAYCFRSRLHHNRYWATVRVSKHYRRQGLARELLRELGDRRSVPLPFAAKLRADSTALRFVEALGGRPYQVLPAARLDVTASSTLQWSEGLPGSDYALVDGTQLTDQQLIDAWCDMYVWVHEEWSPVTSRDDVARVFGADITLDLERELSFFVLGPAGPVAGTFAFNGPRTEPLDVVAETMARDGDGAALAACVRAVTQSAREKGWQSIGFDCHRDDPHLYPILRTAPRLDGIALYSMEYDPAEIRDSADNSDEPAELM